MATQHKGKKTMNTKLIDAVFEQLGADDRDEFRDTLRDVLQGGASAGFHGFIYYTETRAFYLEHRALILEQLREDADGVGAESVISLVASFNCADDCTEGDSASPVPSLGARGCLPRQAPGEADGWSQEIRPAAPRDHGWRSRPSPREARGFRGSS